MGIRYVDCSSFFFFNYLIVRDYSFPVRAYFGWARLGTFFGPCSGAAFAPETVYSIPRIWPFLADAATDNTPLLTRATHCHTTFADERRPRNLRWCIQLKWPSEQCTRRLLPPVMPYKWADISGFHVDLSVGGRRAVKRGSCRQVIFAISTLSHSTIGGKVTNDTFLDIRHLFVSLSTAVLSW